MMHFLKRCGTMGALCIENNAFPNLVEKWGALHKNNTDTKKTMKPM